MLPYAGMGKFGDVLASSGVERVHTKLGKPIQVDESGYW